MKKTVIILTGAGMSAESGIKTFRDANGLWEGHDVMKVASPEGWEENPELVLDFYNQRRRQLKEVEPNAGHLALVELETKYRVIVVTQNVDDLHERAGSSDVIHLHGELRKVRSTGNPELVYDWKEDLHWGDQCEQGFQLRPHIVWFGERVPKYEEAFEVMHEADVVIIVGTSMQVYPAAGLVYHAPSTAPVYFIDPRPQVDENDFTQIHIFAEPATTGVRKVVDALLK